MERIIKIINKLSDSFGEDYLNKISHAFRDAIDADYVFISQVSKDRLKSSTISLVTKDEILENFEYELINTPCQNVLEKGVCCYPNNVCQEFPLDQLLIDMEIKGYLGIPLYDSNRKCTGLIVALYKNEIKNKDEAATLFQIFSERISAEIDRKKYEDKITTLNDNLEIQVKERTKELEDALLHLENAKNKIVETEKIAALGQVVSGVAHEVNTPLGISITTHSVLQDYISELEVKFENNKISKSDVSHFFEQSKKILKMQESNLFRVRDLIDDFKKTVIETSVLEKEDLNIPEFYNDTIEVMNGYLETNKIDINIESTVTNKINTYPALHNQIILNLVNNTVMHSFDNNEINKEIDIQISELGDGMIQVDYKDNGGGIDFKYKDKIFEPFFTVSRKNGGTGLGLSIVYNIISQQLKGDIELIEDPDYFHLRYTFLNEKLFLNT